LDISVLDIHGDINSSVKSGVSGIFLEDKVVFGVVEEIDEVLSGIEVVIVSGSRGTVTEESETANKVVVVIGFAFVIARFPSGIVLARFFNSCADVNFK
jgi:hypothetical protein